MADAPSILPAIFGLVGTLVGAGISGGITYVVAIRRERIETERERRIHAADVIRGARLIEGDLGHAAVRLALARDNNYWWDVELQPLSTESWDQYRGVIAAELSYEDWISVWVAVEAIRNLKMLDRLTREMPANRGIRTPRITEGDREVITRALEEIKQGRLALHSLDAMEANNRGT
jgi:hypothetical protein